MPSLITPQTIGFMIYAELMPIPGVVLEQVEKAEKAFELLGGTMPARAVRPASGDPEKTPRGRASMNPGIVACLSTAPMKMWTPRQVLSAIKSANPQTTIDSLKTRLKNNAGKPGLWISGPGNKYGMPGAVARVGTNSKTATGAAANHLSVVPARAARPGEKAQPRVLEYIEGHSGCMKAEVITAFKTSPTPVKENHVGVALGRLKKSKKITDSENGPYWPLAAAKPTAAAAAEQPTA